MTSLKILGTLEQPSVDLLFLRLFKRFFKLGVRGGFRVRVGDSFRVKVRDKVSFRAGFYVLRPEAIRIKFALAEDSERKTKSFRDSVSSSKFCNIGRKTSLNRLKYAIQ